MSKAGLGAGSTLNHWPFPTSNLPEGYAYMLTHPGTPCVFWDHWQAQGLGDSINQLLKCRQQHGLHCRSKVGSLHTRRQMPAHSLLLLHSTVWLVSASLQPVREQPSL